MPELGSLRINSAETVYVSSAHWSAILESISELRGYVQSRDQDELAQESNVVPETPIDQTQQSYEGLDLFSGRIPAISKLELVAAMPDRAVANRLVYRYFNSFLLTPVMIHRPSFLRQYEEFWANPLQTDTMWIALLYGTMCLASSRESLSTTRSLSDRRLIGGSQQEYLKGLIQGLILGDFSRGGDYVVVAMVHYLFIEHLRRPDMISGNWLLLGMIIRLALRMGYHRDPSRFPELSPLQGELRRRLWLALYSADLLLSIQMGVPRMIKDGQWDTKPPRNLFDDDFNESSQELPPSRPFTETTPVSSQLDKFELLQVIAKISDMTLAITEGQHPCPNPAVESLDTLLRSTYDSIPECRKFTSISNSLMVPPDKILDQLVVSIFFRKGLIILHRWHVMSSATMEAPYGDIARNSGANSDIAASIQIYVRAALEILEYQDLVYSEIKPNGVLSELKWTIPSSLSHEFLMATSVLCTHLYRTATNAVGVEKANTFVEGDAQLRAIKQSLVRACEIWKMESTFSKDAERMAEMVTALLEKLQTRGEPQHDSTRPAADLAAKDLPSQALAQNGHDSFFLYLESYEALERSLF
ncbi:hypothetical protein jhhlp_006647 [Lomentospora prolificans]|uniref:Xylanolytic transcriptional activator regulatory domain-containing protein n=1 Tax=Lomentospora prolificans TaxID=41688 RepID=A0A2N3N6H3_9PEZI|nr:hypothetical protein jhhlp_006647 [Lomentospora prolificans]